MYRKIEETPEREKMLMLLAKTYDCSLDYLAGISDQPRKYGNNARNRTVSEKIRLQAA